MKKTLAILSLIALAIGCAKEPVTENNVSGTVFRAEFEQAPAAKTTLDAGKVLWEATDEIKILWDGGSTTAVASGAGASAQFIADVAPASVYYAVYPSSAPVSLSGSTLSMSIPSAQNGNFAEANIAIAKTEGTTLLFKNLCALGKITVSRSDIAEIRLAGRSDEALCGDVSVTTDGEGIPSCGGTPAGKEIVLTPDSGSAFAAGNYYFSAIPGSLEAGLRYTLTTTGGASITKMSPKPGSFIRSKVLNFGAIDEGKPYSLDLFFDFTQSLDWPTSTSASWAELKNCDSGCKTDNGGTATDNPHRRAQVTYTLDGADYDFTFADPDNAVSHNIYLSSSKGVYSGTQRFFGLPAIDGKKLVRVEMVQNASTKTQDSFVRNVGVTRNVYAAADAVADSDYEYVQGGEPQNQRTNGMTYYYELSGTQLNTVYWLASPTNASIIKSLRLFYADADGSEGGADPDPDPTPETRELTFDFSGEPLEGWPTSDKWQDGPGNKNCIYPLDGVNYTFLLTDCGNASQARVGWDTGKGGLTLFATWRYVGLPVLDGFKLIKVSCVNCLSNSSNRKAGIVTNIVADNTGINIITSHTFVSGGESIGWPTNGATYAYNLSGTEAGTMYYILCTGGGVGFSSLTLKYEKVN